MSKIITPHQPSLSASLLSSKNSAVPRIAAQPTFPNRVQGKMSGVSAAGSATVEAGKPLKITSFNELIESLIKGGNLSEGDAEASLDFLLDDASETD